MNDNFGTSLVLLNSEKGKKFWEEVTENVDVTVKKTDISNCLQRNLRLPTPRSNKTEEFWNDFLKYNYKKVVRKYTQYKWYKRPMVSVINCWQKKLESGNGLANILKNRGITKVMVIGDKENSELAIMELKRGALSVIGEIEFPGKEVTQMVPLLLL